MLSDHVGSSASAGSSKVTLSKEDVEIEDLGSIKSRGKGHLVEHGKEATSLSHPIKGILVNKPQSRIKEARS